MTACDRWDVVMGPFPFSVLPVAKLRPSVVLSTRRFNDWGNTIMAMITSSRHSGWPGDVRLDHEAAGLPQPCVARLKIFTIDNRLIQSKLGKLSESDAESLRRELTSYLPA